MIVYFMRHGIAEDTPPSGGDPDRRLTEQGTLRSAMVAKGLKRIGLEFDRIVSSPYVRARQTAEIAARVTGYKLEIGLDRRLVPFGRYEDASDLIRENSDVQTLLLTGHEPSMGEFISGICASGQLEMDVKKASVTAIEIVRLSPKATGTLLWTLPPKIFETLVV